MTEKELKGTARTALDEISDVLVERTALRRAQAEAQAAAEAADAADTAAGTGEARIP